MADTQTIPAPPSGFAVPVSSEVPPPPSGFAVQQSSTEIPAPPSGFAVPVAPAVSPNQPTGAASGTDEWYREKLGELVPQWSVPILSWFQQHINAPLDAMAKKGAEIGGNVGESIAANPGAPSARVIPTQQPALVPKEQLEQEHPVLAGVAKGVGGVAGGAVADPRNWPFLASGAARPLLQRVISGGFAAMMGKSAIDTAQNLHDNWDKLTPAQRSELITQTGLSAAMATASGLHAAGGGEVAPEAQGVEDVAATSKIPAPPSGVAVPVTDALAPTDADTTTPGPGAQNVSVPDGVKESGSDIAQITESLRAKVANQPPSKSVDIASKIGDALADAQESATASLGEAKSQAFGALEKIKAVGQGIAEKYNAPPDTGDLMQSVADWQFAQQKSDLELSRFSDSVKKAFPDPARREAMAIYAEAGGDLDKLAAWEQGSKPELADKYADAQNLSDDEKLFANNARNYWDAKLDQAMDQGILSHGIEDYVMHLVKRENPITNQLRAEVDTGKLVTNPSFAKQRIHQTIYDLEQAGLLSDNDLGKMMATYEQSFNKALSSRAYVKSLLDGKMPDGRPIAVVSSASAHELPAQPGALNDAYLVRPNLHPENTGDYRTVNHPALRGWKWADKLWGDSGANDKNVIVQGDLLIHPDAYRQINNNLGKSWFRNASWNLGGVEIKPFAALMKAGAMVKGTMLDLSGFHQSQITLHGMEHGVAPWDLVKEIDLNDPKQVGLMRWGTQVADYEASRAFSEGSTDGSLIRKVPGLGQVAQAYNEYLFKDFIPRMKMTMGLKALDRNFERYGKELSSDQIYALSAKQSNAAFGELNYKMLGRNPTFQDLARLTLLAPDFLEARARFVGQALKPFGKEQGRALMVGAVSMYVMARVINQAVDNDPHWDKPFSVVYDGKEYRLRTVQGDIEHLIRDPRNFASMRLSPVVTKPLLEGLTGRDEFGRPISLGQVAGDTVKGAIPISFQKWLKNPADFTLLDSLLQSMGVSSTKHFSAGAKSARDYVVNSVPKTTEAADSLKKNQQTRDLQQQYAAGKLPVEQLQQMEQDSEVTQKQARKIVGRVPDTIVTDFSRLPIEKALEFWPDYSAEEQQKLAPVLRKKAAGIDKLDRTTLQKQLLRSQIRQALTK
jgi:hypothetical protein